VSAAVGSASRHRACLCGLVILAQLLIGSANACQVCIPMPVETLADRLLAADALVLAREDPARPFHYAVVEVLKGDPDEAPIDAFLPSVDRRVLAQFPQRHMLLARQEPAGGWSALGIADGDYERVVRRILEHAAQWRPKETSNRQRLAEFLPLLGHRDSRLHQLAYLEIGRAPYAEIRRIAAGVPIETVRGMLEDPMYLEWRSLAILMLAQSGHAADRARILATMDDKQRLRSTFNLAAWTTAYLAIEGANGVAQVRRWYLAQPDRSEEELQAIIKALSVAANADATLREPVIAGYRDLLTTHPAMATAISRDLITWRRWDFTEPMQSIRKTIAQQDPLGAYAIGLYLRSAAIGSRSPMSLPEIVGSGPTAGDDAWRNEVMQQ
jgi:hypothetical protein